MILVVEDDPSIRTSVQAVLEDEGHSTMVAAHGREALDLLRRAEVLPSVILLDWTMPIMDGPTFMAEMVSDGALSNIPVVVLTARDDAQQHLLACRPALILRKPIRLEELLRVVERFIGAEA